MASAGNNLHSQIRVLSGGFKFMKAFTKAQAGLWNHTGWYDTPGLVIVKFLPPVDPRQRREQFPEAVRRWTCREGRLERAVTFVSGTLLLPGDPEGKKQLSKYPFSLSFLLLTSPWGYPLANPNRKLDSTSEFHAIPASQAPKTESRLEKGGEWS